MSDKKPDWKISMPESVRDSVPPEVLAELVTEMQTTLVTGGIDALLAQSKAVVFIESADACCAACGGPLAQEKGWPSYVCANPAEDCKEIVYYVGDLPL